MVHNLCSLITSPAVHYLILIEGRGGGGEGRGWGGDGEDSVPQSSGICLSTDIAKVFAK